MLIMGISPLFYFSLSLLPASSSSYEESSLLLLMLSLSM
jgi:hypothetical protein